MAEDNRKPAFDFSDPNINTVYANDTAAIVGDAEINLYFSDGAPLSPDGSQKRLSTRVVISHAAFIHMMDFWMERYNFIRSVYGGTPVNLRDIQANEPDRYEAAFQQFLVVMKNREPKQDE